MADLAAVIERARAANVERSLVVLTGGDGREAAQAEQVLSLWPQARLAIGVHPHVAHEYAGDPARATAIVREQIARSPAVRAVGEIGLDYHYDFSPRDVQNVVFRDQVRLAVDLGLPVVIHTREADAETLEVLSAEGGSRLRGVIHCFTGDDALARGALDLGFYISLAGIVTFPKAETLRQTVRRLPLDRLLAETDSPYLTPVPYRGKRNEPAHVVHVARSLAELLSVSLDEVVERTDANFHALFRP